MTPPVHLEGLGLMGALTGQLLEHSGLDFTWSDPDDEVCGLQAPAVSAWRACTGIIYPSGHALDNENLAAWLANGWCCDGFRETATWTYYSTNPPHGGRFAEVGRVGNVRVSDRWSVHVNAQSMVPELRRRWNATRTSGPSSDQFTIVTHGFDRRTIYRWSWGWSARVRLALPDALWALVRPQRPALYLRDGYVLDYAYPVPGEPLLWYAGTSLVTQRYARDLDARAAFGRWMKRFSKKAAGLELLGSAPPIGAWRPIPRPDAPLLIQLGPRLWAIRPQYGNALRHWWTTAVELLKVLRLAEANDWNYTLAQQEDA